MLGAKGCKRGAGAEAVAASSSQSCQGSALCLLLPFKGAERALGGPRRGSPCQLWLAAGEARGLGRFLLFSSSCSFAGLAEFLSVETFVNLHN